MFSRSERKAEASLEKITEYCISTDSQIFCICIYQNISKDSNAVKFFNQKQAVKLYLRNTLAFELLTFIKFYRKNKSNVTLNGHIDKINTSF